MSNDGRMAEITAIQEKYIDELMAYPNVVGVGVGYRQHGNETTDELSLIVLVDEKLPVAQLAPEHILPTELEGITVDVQETGSFSA